MNNQVRSLLSTMRSITSAENTNVSPTVTLVWKIKPAENKFILPRVFGEKATAYVRQKLYDNRSETELTLVKGLGCSRDVERRTFSTIVRDFVNTSPYGLLKVRTNKGDIYYGNKNIILDKYFHPLFVPAREFSIDGQPMDYVSLIDPIVFTRTDVISNNLKKDVVAHFGTIDKVLIMPLSDYLISSSGPVPPEGINKLVQKESALIAESLKLW